MPVPTDLKYSPTHEWTRLDGETATIGITDHAQEELGDVALTLLPEVGRILQRGEKLGEIESIKAVSDLYAPVSGEVVAVNEALTDAPEQVMTILTAQAGCCVSSSRSLPSELAA